MSNLKIPKCDIEMSNLKIYIQAAQQISIQQPLSESWMMEPVFYDEPLVKAINPSFRDFMAANEARRMGNVMKRALVTALQVLRDSGVEHPDAMMTGTGLGCLDSTEKFLNAMVENGEQTLSPTHFMQSTHNTIGSALAIYTNTHGYNTTYSHSSMSFDLALLDAWMQMKIGKIDSALVGGHDEMVDSYFELLKKIGYVGAEGMVPCGEVAVSMMLNRRMSSGQLCELASITLYNTSSLDELKSNVEDMLKEAGMTVGDISAVMTGVNGNPWHDHYYQAVTNELFADVPLLHYKHLFGENFTASAFGVYAAAHCLKKGSVPSCLYDAGTPRTCDTLRTILILNQMNGSENSLVLLRKV